MDIPTSLCFESVQWDLKHDKALEQGHEHQIHQSAKRRGSMGKPSSPVYSRESSRSPTRPRRQNSRGAELEPHQRRGSMGRKSNLDYRTGRSKSPLRANHRSSAEDAEARHQQPRQRAIVRRGSMGRESNLGYSTGKSKSPLRTNHRSSSGDAEAIHQLPHQRTIRRGSLGKESTPGYRSGQSRSPTRPSSRRNSGDTEARPRQPQHQRATQRGSLGKESTSGQGRRPSLSPPQSGRRNSGGALNNRDHRLGKESTSGQDRRSSLSPPQSGRRNSGDVLKNHDHRPIAQPPRVRTERRTSIERKYKVEKRLSNENRSQGIGLVRRSADDSNDGAPVGVQPITRQMPRQQSFRREQEPQQLLGESNSSINYANGPPGVLPPAGHIPMRQQSFRREREAQQQHHLNESLSSIPFNPAARSNGRRGSLGGSGERQDAFGNSLSSMEASGDFAMKWNQEDRLQQAKLVFDQHNDKNFSHEVKPVGVAPKQRGGLLSLLNRRKSMSNVTDEHVIKATSCFDRHQEVQTKGFVSAIVPETTIVKNQEPEMQIPMHPSIPRRAKRRSSMPSGNFVDPSTEAVPRQGGGRRGDLARSTSVSRFRVDAQVRNFEADIKKQEEILLGFLLKPAPK